MGWGAINKVVKEKGGGKCMECMQLHWWRGTELVILSLIIITHRVFNLIPFSLSLFFLLLFYFPPNQIL